MGTHLDIGNLACHSDHKRKIGKIEKIRLLFIGKFETSGTGKSRALVFVVIIPMSVVHREHGMDEEPRGNHGGGCEKKMFGKSFLAQSLATADQNCDRNQTGDGGKNHEEEDHETRRILKFSCLHTGLGTRQDYSCPCEHSHAPGKDIPYCNGLHQQLEATNRQNKDNE